MQLPSYTPAVDTTGIQQAADSGQVEVVRSINDALARDDAIVGYYSHLISTMPQYAELHSPVVSGSADYCAIRDQLIALTAKASSLLFDLDNDSGSASRLRHGLMHKLACDSLEDYERDYFFSRIFKETFEEKVARADLAPPGDTAKAMQELHAICYLLGDPSAFVLYAAAANMLQDFSSTVGLRIDGPLDARALRERQAGAARDSNSPPAAITANGRRPDGPHIVNRRV
ncbi:hypothetical protein BOSP111201_10880 [Bordetella sputigena]|uniref:hypothetical protein n=1 Tax=Bordetella sputigena TaxID=1416810 RepID=UPI0039EFB01F